MLRHSDFKCIYSRVVDAITFDKTNAGNPTGSDKILVHKHLSISVQDKKIYKQLTEISVG